MAISTTTEDLQRTLDHERDKARRNHELNEQALTRSKATKQRLRAALGLGRLRRAGGTSTPR